MFQGPLRSSHQGSILEKKFFNRRNFFQNWTLVGISIEMSRFIRLQILNSDPTGVPMSAQPLEIPCRLAQSPTIQAGNGSWVTWILKLKGFYGPLPTLVRVYIIPTTLPWLITLVFAYVKRFSRDSQVKWVWAADSFLFKIYKPRDESHSRNYRTAYFTQSSPIVEEFLPTWSSCASWLGLE